MSLSVVIRDHDEEIIREFAIFAKTLVPPGDAMSEAELRDHAEEVLSAMGVDLGTAQTAHQESHVTTACMQARGCGTTRADSRRSDS